MTTIPAVVDVNASIANLYITNTNALVVSTFGEFTPAIIAFQLNGTQATRINTGGTAEMFANMLPYIAGDGNTVLAYKLRQVPPLNAPVSFLQIIKFSAAGVPSSRTSIFRSPTTSPRPLSAARPSRP
jgi:hypothetical protein